MSEHPSLRVVFRGEIVDGFDRDAVKRVAAERLGASPAQIEQVFSGQPVVLKKGLDPVTGDRYVALLARIGMRATLLPMPTPPATPPAALPQADTAVTATPEPPAPAPVTAPPAPAPAAPFDPEATHLTQLHSAGNDDAGQDSPADAAATQLYVPREAQQYTCSKCGTAQVKRSRCWQCGHPTDAPWPPVDTPPESPRPRAHIPVVVAESTISPAEPTVVVPLDRPADAPVHPVTEMGLLSPSRPAEPPKQSRTMLWMVLATVALVGGLMWLVAG